MYPEKLARQRRDTRRVFGLLGLLLLGLLALTGYRFLSDIGPVDDSDIVPVFTGREPGAENPLGDYVDWLSAHPVPTNSRLSELAYEDFSTDWPVEEAHTALAPYEPLLVRFDELIASNAERWRIKEFDAQVRPDSVAAALAALSQTQSALAVKAKVLIAAGDDRGALVRGLCLLRLQRRLQRSEGDLMVCYNGWSLQNFGLQTIREALASSSGQAQGLLEYAQAEMALLEPDPRDLAFPIRVTYLAKRNQLLDPSTAAAAIAPLAVVPTWARPAFRRNETVSWLHESTKSFLAAIPKDWAAVAAAFAANEALHPRFPLVKLSDWKRGNFVGMYVARQATSELHIHCQKAFLAQLLHRLALCQIALRRFELAEKKLPSTLDDLVPRYLRQVPLEPFSGRPMRWSPTRYAVYGDGMDGRDDGGDIDFSRSDSLTSRSNRFKDVGAAYWWRPKSPNSPKAASTRRKKTAGKSP